MGNKDKTYGKTYGHFYIRAVKDLFKPGGYREMYAYVGKDGLRHAALTIRETTPDSLKGKCRTFAVDFDEEALDRWLEGAENE